MSNLGIDRPIDIGQRDFASLLRKPLLFPGILHNNYVHHVCSLKEQQQGFYAKLSLGLYSEDEAKKWLGDFQSSSQTAFRVLRTKSVSGNELHRKILYEVGLQHEHILI